VTVFVVISLIVLAVSGTLGAVAATGARRHARRAEADDLEAVRLRLIDAGELPAAPTHPGTGRRSAMTAVGVAEVTPVDARIVKLVVDPTLTDADVATAVEHVAPGVGSLASFAATVEDTRMRTPSQVKELQVAELAAYAYAEEEEERRLFADYNRRMNAALARFDTATRRADQWEAYQHRGNEDACAHCHRAVKENSDEFRTIVARIEAEHTGEISREDIDAMYALHGATT
jgi:hypothetical protein